MQHVTKHNPEEQKQRDEMFGAEKEKKSKKKRNAIAIAVVLISAIIAIIAYASLSPGNYDSFAKCLTEKGVVMYGEDWCQYTQGQKAMFGKSFKYVNYQQDPTLELRPTWVIDGKTYQRVQSFERLAALTDCAI